MSGEEKAGWSALFICLYFMSSMVFMAYKDRTYRHEIELKKISCQFAGEAHVEQK